MRRFHPSRFGWLLVLTLGLWAVMAQAQEYRYRYVSLLKVELPSGFIFFDPIAINNGGWVYGVAYDDLFIDPHVAVYADGAVTILQPRVVYAANEGGTIGGSVLIDPVNFIEQAALFHGDQAETYKGKRNTWTASRLMFHISRVILPYAEHLSTDRG